jgi:hypothetical protein
MTDCGAKKRVQRIATTDLKDEEHAHAQKISAIVVSPQ